MSLKWTHLISYAVLFALIGLAVIVLPAWNRPIWGHDFHLFYQAATALRNGQNPYTYDFHDPVYSFHNPIYTLIYYVPLSFLPERLAMIVNSGLAAAAIWWVFQRLSRSPLLGCLALCSSSVFLILMTGNADWLALLGGVAIPPLGIWLALIKPQMGVVLAIVYAWLIYRRSQRQFVVIMGLLLAVFALSFAMGMRWQNMIAIPYNLSFFPVSIPLGLYVGWLALKRQGDRAAALAAGPCLAPYVAIQSWSAVFPFLTRQPLILALALSLSWFA